MTALYHERRAILTGYVNSEATQEQDASRKPRARGGVSME